MDQVEKNTIIQALEDVAPLVEILNGITDALNVSIKMMENRLLGLRLGVVASISIVVSEVKHTFAFEKHDREWQFTIDGEPLRNAARHKRLGAIPFIPDLIKALAMSVKTEIDLVQVRYNQLNEIFNCLEPMVK